MRKKALVFQVIMLVLVNSLAAYKKDGLTKKLLVLFNIVWVS